MRLWLVPAPGPGAAHSTLARPDSGQEQHWPLWLVPSTGPGAESIGSSRRRARSQTLKLIMSLQNLKRFSKTTQAMEFSTLLSRFGSPPRLPSFEPHPPALGWARPGGPRQGTGPGDPAVSTCSP